MECFVSLRSLVIASVSVAVSLAGCTSDPAMPDGGGSACPMAQYEWATSGGGPGQGDGVTGVALSPDGSVWVTGTFIGTATWGTFQLTAADTVHPSIFIAKLDPAGKVVLARVLQEGAAGIDGIDNEPTRIRVDGAGNPVVVGKFEGKLDVDSIHLDTALNTGGNGDAFLIGFDGATGTAMFGTQSMGNTDGVEAYDVAFDAQGNLYVTGRYNGALELGNVPAPTSVSSESAVFVAKYSPATTAWVWAKGWAGQVDRTNDGGMGYGVAVTTDGNLYVAGTIAGTLKIEGTVLDADQGSFVAKLAAADGTVAWTKQIVPNAQGADAQISAAAVDSTGNIYVTGHFDKAATFDAKALTTTAGGVDMFFAKYDPSGALAWVQQAGNADGVGTRGDDVAFDGEALYVAGFMQGDTSFGGTMVTETSPLFVAKYDTAGHVVWTQSAVDEPDSSASNEAAAIGVRSPTSGLLIGGSYDVKTTFGSTTLDRIGNGDAFVAELCN